MCRWSLSLEDYLFSICFLFLFCFLYVHKMISLVGGVSSRGTKGLPVDAGGGGEGLKKLIDQRDTETADGKE